MCVVVVVGTWCNLPIALNGGVGGKEARSSLSLTKELLAGS